MESSERQIKEIIGEILSISAEEIQQDTQIRALPRVESILILNIILKVEKRYGLEIPDEATFRLETVGEFVRMVDGLRAAQPQLA